MVGICSRSLTKTLVLNLKPAISALPPTLSPSFSRLQVCSLIMADSAFKKIQIQRDDTTFDAYVVGKEDAPGIVVLQEWWGVDFEIRNHALKVSQFDSGYKALIPDLYRGKVGLDAAEAQHLMDGLDWQGAVKDIRASVNWLKANGSQKVGVTGFCMGGALSIASSVLVPEVDAVVAFYGVPSSELADPAHAKGPRAQLVRTHLQPQGTTTLTPLSLSLSLSPPMAFEDEHTVYGGEEDLDEDDDDESEDPPPDLDDDDEIEDEEEEDDDTSSSNLAPGDPPPPPSSVAVTVAIAPKPSPSTPTTATATVATVSLPDPKRQRIDDVTIAAVFEEKKPLAVLDDSRRLFQRLWTDEDEIELLQGFLDYTNQRGGGNSSHHHDTTAFYDQIKSKLQLEFNKNQLVEKLRRLKKKYRNVLSKIGSGKEYVFKSPHDQATFEISKKIWSSAADRGGAGGGAGEEGGLEDDESNPNPNPNPNANPNLLDHNSNGVVDPNSSEKKGSRSRKRSRVKIEEKHQFINQQQPQQQNATPIAAATATSIPNLIEETVRSCLSPLFKELLHNAMNGAGGSRGFGAVAALNPMPLSFGSPAPLNFPGGDSMDEKWRKQQILELEVYSKRLELVQDQIKSALEELRSI